MATNVYDLAKRLRLCNQGIEGGDVAGIKNAVAVARVVGRVVGDGVKMENEGQEANAAALSPFRGSR